MVEVGFTEAEDTSLPEARVSSAVIMPVDITAGTAQTMGGMALIGAIRIMDSDGDLILVLALVGPIGQAMQIRMRMALGVEHHTITLTIVLLTHTLTIEAMMPGHQIAVRNPAAIPDTIIRKLPREAPQASTP